MKKLSVVAALLLGLVLGSSPVVAAPPKEPNPFAPVLNEGTGDLNDFCGFDIAIILVGKIKSISLPGERTTTVSPGAKITLTSEFGKTVTYVITGVIHEQILLDAKGKKFIDVQATGTNLLLLPEPNSGLALTTGNFHYTLNLDKSERTRFDAGGPGQVVDVCAALS